MALLAVWGTGHTVLVIIAIIILVGLLRLAEEIVLSRLRARGVGISRVIIAGAGHAAHLAGAMAAGTWLPVIGVPIDSSPLKGFDALLATVQMPPGVPVATVGVGSAGAKNAAVLAARILALSDDDLAGRLDAWIAAQTEAVVKKNEKLQDKL